MMPWNVCLKAYETKLNLDGEWTRDQLKLHG